ncbi:MAG: pyridoxamine 5'-phosphate oxidase [Bacteroidia bacterium]|nr:pyridoxamine 5'-phosphate oxidase [Bacteroidia bacterium]
MNFTSTNIDFNPEDVKANDPMVLFSLWLEEAIAAGLPEPTAMTLATSGNDGQPSARIVLLKQADEYGFVFYSNYHSKKGRQISENENVALVFYWQAHGRQVRVEGTARKINAGQSDEYFYSRPEESRISSIISAQSEEISSREYLEKLYNDFSEKNKGKALQRPDHWGGYIVIPELIEFWQEGKHRLHERIAFTRTKNSWKVSRLAP